MENSGAKRLIIIIQGTRTFSEEEVEQCLH